MADCWLEFHGDFLVDATGDLQIADGDDEVRQRIERRLYTAVGGYIWVRGYGAGLPQKIGSVLTREQIQSVVMSQLALETSIAPSPAPTILIQQQPNQPDTIIISIAYFDAVAGVTVSFDITS
jgi:hypothetical protein